MFYGEFEHAIDRKSRIIIPAKFRQTLRDNNIDKLFVTRGLEVCLFVFAEPEWRSIETRFKQLSFTKVETRKFNRLFFSGAAEVRPDGLGRVLLPKHLKEFAQIKQDVVVLGVLNRMEIWAKEQWREQYESTRQSYEDVAERVLLE